MRHSIAPSPLMPSTTSTAGVFAVNLPNASTSCPTPVLVSLRVQNTAPASGCSLSAAASMSGVTALP